jgi:hypothetical protein
MKRLSKLLCIAITIHVATVLAEAASLLTFDGLPTPQVLPGLNYGPIPNGYGGLRWNNFGALDGSIRPTKEGYHAGIVSPNNVAFNFYGKPATISSATSLFDLNSAYLSLGLNLDTPLHIEVQGYRGATILYDHTFTVDRFAPTLLTFDYFGIDRATFISSPEQQFAMDNLIVTIPEPSLVGFLIASIIGVGIRNGCRKSTRVAGQSTISPNLRPRECDSCRGFLSVIPRNTNGSSYKFAFPQGGRQGLFR